MSERDEQNHHENFFQKHMENYNVETSALHRKLQSKIAALNIMRIELEKFRTERDQFKLMAETVQLRYSSIKRNTDFSSNLGYGGKPSTTSLLNETREKNVRLATEAESLRQKLLEFQGDLEILRRNKEAITNEGKSKLSDSQGSSVDAEKETEEWRNEKGKFISHLENLRKKNAQLSFDLKTLIDEKEEAITERDAYKCKAHRLNHELLVALKVNKNHPRIVDIDALILENKYLQDKLKNCENELETAQQAVNKYKNMLDNKRKKGIIKLGTNNIDSIISHKQVKSVLENNGEFPTKAETITELKSLCLALLDNLNDKNVALSHQKKTNKILATRLAELEQRIQLMSGIELSSPSQILLNGYCSANVDKELKSTNATEISAEISEDSQKTSQVISDDGMDSLSSESNKSIVSSEYGTTSIFNNTEGSFSVQTTEDKIEISPSVEKERTEDLKDLPSDLADMVKKALHELDMKEIKCKELKTGTLHEQEERTNNSS